MQCTTEKANTVEMKLAWMCFVQLKLSQAVSERLSATVAKTTHGFFEDTAQSMPQPAIDIAVYLPVTWRPLPRSDAN